MKTRLWHAVTSTTAKCEREGRRELQRAHHLSTACERGSVSAWRPCAVQRQETWKSSRLHHAGDGRHSGQARRMRHSPCCNWNSKTQPLRLGATTLRVHECEQQALSSLAEGRGVVEVDFASVLNTLFFSSAYPGSLVTPPRRHLVRCGLSSLR